MFVLYFRPWSTYLAIFLLFCLQASTVARLVFRILSTPHLTTIIYCKVSITCCLQALLNAISAVRVNLSFVFCLAHEHLTADNELFKHLAQVYSNAHPQMHTGKSHVVSIKINYCMRYLYLFYFRCRLFWNCF